MNRHITRRWTSILHVWSVNHFNISLKLPWSQQIISLFHHHMRNFLCYHIHFFKHFQRIWTKTTTTENNKNKQLGGHAHFHLAHITKILFERTNMICLFFYPAIVVAVNWLPCTLQNLSTFTVNLLDPAAIQEIYSHWSFNLRIIFLIFSQINDLLYPSLPPPCISHHLK